jgi:hypothetical protein
MAGQEDRSDIGHHALELGDDHQAFHIRHLVIDDGHMDGGVFCDFEGGLAVFGREHIKAFDFGAFGGGRQKFGVVIYQQDVDFLSFIFYLPLVM